jgi:hypothetical protein
VDPVEGAPGEPLCRDMTDFRRLSAAKRKLEEFEISKDASRLGAYGMCQLNGVGRPNLNEQG